MSKKIVLTGTAVPRVVEFTADATAAGKTLGALRMRYHLDELGVANTLVAIESRGVESYKTMRPGDVFIPTEDFSRAAELPGGLAGVLKPLYVAIELAAKAGSVIIIDWAGGHTQNRLEAFAATGFDQRLAELNMSGLSVIVTTSASDRMRQAAENLRRTAEIVPLMRRALLLNERQGSFAFQPGTAAAAAHADLLRAAEGASLLRFAAIRGESWQECEAAGLTLPAVKRATPSHVASKTRLDTFSAAACISEVAAWWLLTARALAPVFPFPGAAGASTVKEPAA
ncbi:MAG: hypothetical protein AB1490_00380 [Pseudomonadota bacterium]